MGTEKGIAMEKWATYWMLHCIGLAGMLATLFLLPQKLLPGYAMGAIGGLWMAAFMCLARWLVTRRQTPNAEFSGARAAG